MSNRMLLHVKGLLVRAEERLLFQNLSFSVHRGEVVALIGANGCGKSTILQVLYDGSTRGPIREPQVGLAISGEVHLQPGIAVTFLRQEVESAVALPSLEGNAGSTLVSRYERLSLEFGLGGAPQAHQLLSDGQRQKWAIVLALLEDADVYLLDEPTNFLDLKALSSLEHHLERLKRQGKGVVLVTHDRAITDNVADRTILLTPHDIYVTSGGSSEAWSIRDHDIESRHERAGAIRRKIEQLQADIRAKSGWAAKSEKRKIGAGRERPYFSTLSRKMAKRAKAVRKRVEREMETLEATKPVVAKKLRLYPPQYQVRKRQVFTLTDVCFRYDSGVPSKSSEGVRYVLEDISIGASTRDKICLMGTNGCGKTTLIRLILQELIPQRGRVSLNSGVPCVHLAQGLEGYFTEKVLADNFDDCGVDRTTVRRHLGAVFIRDDKVGRPLEEFSAGELMRAAIVRCLLSKAEFLFLDEPTSHLDIESIEVLEQLLRQSPGGFLLISHDRAFVENVADVLYLIEDGKLRLV